MDLTRLIGRIVKRGSLAIVGADGSERRFGDGTGADIAIRIASSWSGLRMALNPPLEVGEAYMDGRLQMVRGSIYDLLMLAGHNGAMGYAPTRDTPARRLLRRIRRIASQRNARAAARRNVAHHYDLSNALYARFLDADMQYSCAYFAAPGMSLEAAQIAKKRHVAAKLALTPGARVLDIGCGWGGLALTLAAEHGADVTGITLSRAQQALAERRAHDAGLAANARFAITDYRDIQGRFDRIVSIGMFEHVGVPNYQAYFDAVARLLADDGVALVHTIARHDEPAVTNPWLARHIFPGGYIPALSEILPAIERAGLWLADCEVLRLHYAETLRCWRDRFIRERDAIVDDYDDRFFRMFEFYLAGAEAAFRRGGLMVAQLQLTKRVDTLPITRDYLYAPAAAEGAIAQAAQP